MKTSSAKDLRSMSASDLATEERLLRTELTKQRMGIAVRAEKDTAKYRRGRRHLARILTVRSEKTKAPALKKKASSSRVSAPVSQ